MIFTPLIFSSHDLALLLSPFSPWILPVRSKIFHIQFLPTHIRPTTQRATIQYRPYNTIDVDNFKSDILTSPLYTNLMPNNASNASDLADQFSSTLKFILDIDVPIRSETVVQRTHTPWINPEILQAKRE